MKKLNADIESGNFKSIYLLYGPEAYLRLHYAKKLCDAILPSSDSLNFLRLDGPKTEETAIIDFAETLPFLADRRLVRIQDSGFFKKSLDRLPDYLKKVPPYATLVFVEAEIDKRSRLFKAIQANGYAVEFPVQNEATLLRWGAGLLARAGIRIRKEDLQYLLQRTGYDMSRLATELDKLIHYLRGLEAEAGWREDALAEAYALEEARLEAEMYGYAADFGNTPEASKTSKSSHTKDKAAVPFQPQAFPSTELVADRAAIDAVTTILLEDHIFDMLRAVASRDTDTALALYAELLGLKEAPIKILVMLEREFNRLLMVKDLMDRRASQLEIEKETGIRSFAIRRYQGQLRGITRESLLAALRLLADTDEKIKTGRLTDRIGVELALVQLARG